MTWDRFFVASDTIQLRALVSRCNNKLIDLDHSMLTRVRSLQRSLWHIHGMAL